VKRATRALVLLVLLSVAGAGVLLALTPSPGTAPSFDAVRAAACPSDACLIDRHGAVLNESRIDPSRRRLAWTPLADVSPALVTALLASEDRRFFSHHGVDWAAVGGAVWQRVRGGTPRGASTLTMQVAALLDPALRQRGGPRTLSQKWSQMRAAWDLERAWSKTQILEAYLNLVTFRGELQGVRAAAQIAFGKAPHGLTNGESLTLAALVRAPNADRAALTRRTALLAASPSIGERDDALANGDLAAAIDRVLDLQRGAGARIALAPQAARRLLAPSAAAACADTPSTLDADTQRYAIDSVRRHLLSIRDRSVRDAAVLVADNATGDVLAYVAASGELSSARQVDGIRAQRQAGSTLKPFLYGLLLDRRLSTAASLLDDSPLEIEAGSGLFRPRDYDDQFRGLVSLRTALAGSLNVPAVRALLLVGADTFADQLRELGFAGVVQPGDYYGPSLALGSADVTLWQLVNAYRTLANGGVWTPLRLQDAAHASPDARDGAREPSAMPARRAYSQAAAFVVSDILSDRDSRSVTFGLESPLATPFWSAVKTGTSKDMRDNWCIGYSRRYTVGVWVGNFSGEPMHDVSGITGAAPIWQDVMQWLHRDLASEPPAPPAGVRAADAAFADAVEPMRREWFLSGTEPSGAPPVRARAPRITAPTDGAIIAIDPDIPPPRQRVAFTAAAPRPDLRWVLDGSDIGPATQTALWRPVRGRHTLSLVDAQARPLGEVRFEVRGPTT
jgi:penicillin-binding protein 1C